MINEFDKLCNKILSEEKTRLDPSCQKGYKKGNPKTKTIGKGAKKRRVNNCVKENYPRRMTKAPSADRLRLDDTLKQRMLEHGMMLFQQHGASSSDIIAALGKITRGNERFDEIQKQAIYNYLGGDFASDLEAKLDEYDKGYL